jgi:hypothetical protein
MNAPTQGFYRGQQVAFLTQHGKQDLLRGPLESALGCRLLHTDAWDTDQLGTFTRDQSRPCSPMDAARRKAGIGMALTGARLGLASEGSFGIDPYGAQMPWNTEILLWVDSNTNIEIIGLAHGPAQSLQRTVKTMAELLRFADDARFPEHHLVLRPEHPQHPNVVKGICDAPNLERAFDWARQHSAHGEVFVENDLRAFANPTRQQMILKASQDLLVKLNTHCPSCAKPGYCLSEQIPGLPCRACGAQTRVPQGEKWSCSACGHTAHRTNALGQWADPSRCDLCNP